MTNRERMTQAGWENRQARLRARQRARHRTAMVYEKEFRQAWEAEKSDLSYYGARERAVRKTVERHPRTFRHVYAEELAKETLMELKIGRPPKVTS